VVGPPGKFQNKRIPKYEATPGKFQKLKYKK
jgi:hypothetical protein